MSFCSNCGVPHAVAARFCGECGEAVSDAGGAEVRKRDLSSASFVERLGNELFNGGDISISKPPHACLAVCVVDGRIHSVIRSGSDSDKPGLLQRLISRIRAALANTFDQNAQEKSVFLISDFSRLPVISVRVPAPTVSSPERSALFSFWVGGEDREDAAIEIFLRSVVQSAGCLSVAEFQGICDSILESALQTTPVSEILGSEGVQKEFSALLLRQYGIVCEIDIRDEAAVSSQFFELGARASVPRCSSCTSEVGFDDEFCSGCGERLLRENARADASDELLSKEGERLTLRVRLVEAADSGQAEIDIARAQRLLHPAIKDLLSRHSAEELSIVSVRDRIGSELVSRVLPSLGPTARSLQITDIRFSNRDWEVKAEANLASQRVRLKSALRALDLEESSLDYEEAARDIALRKARQEFQGRIEDAKLLAQGQSQLDKIEQGKQLDGALLESETRNKINRIDLDDRIEQLQIESEFSEAEKNEKLLSLGREELLEQHSSRVEATKSKIGFSRESRELEQRAALERRQLDHRADLERRQAEHKRELEREALEEELHKRERKAKAELNLMESSKALESEEADRDQNRALKKLQAMADLEASMADQEARHELDKSAQESASEVRRAGAMANMTPEQMLAFQAAELAKLAEDPSAIAAIASSIAEAQSNKAGTKLQQEQYERMLSLQEKNAENMEASSAKAQELLQQNTKMAMETMARVAAAASGEQPASPPVVAADSKKKSSNEHQCRAPGCDYSAKSGFKFCPKCGEGQQ